MGSYFADGLKDLCDDKPRQRRSSRRRSPKHTDETREERRPDAASSSNDAEGVRRPRRLAFDPLKSPAKTRTTRPAEQHPPVPPPNLGNMNQQTQDLIANMTALFSELGAEGQDQEASPKDDLTECILQSLNTTAEEDEPDAGLTDDMDQATVGKVLAESVMKQLLAKSILYEPMKDLSDKYAEWLQSDAVTDLSSEEQDRHRHLHGSIKELIHVYETDPENMPKLMELFEQSQSYGSPPEDVYQSLVDSTDAASDDQNGLPTCFTQ